MHIDYYQNFLNKQKQELKLRSLTDSQTGDKLDFSTNDYLSLSKHPELIKAAIEDGFQYGVGATGSRLLSGSNSQVVKLEKMIAEDKNMESALYFQTGFQANFSCIRALLDSHVLREKPIVFFDKRNHNSLYQAIFNTNIDLIRYRTLEDLKEKCNLYSQDKRPKFLITETVFGMDGDIVDIRALKELSLQYQLFVFLDEAHSSGICGKNGLGLSTDVDWTGVPICVIGTFSKALGCMGAYATSSKLIIDYLINKASGFIYSTASSPMVIGACIKAWQLAKLMNKERTHLLNLTDYLKQKLKEKGYKTLSDSTPIIPIIIGDEKRTLDLALKLKEKGIRVSCIRPPTVPIGTSRVRISLTTNHTQEDVDYLIEALPCNL
jgi:8-amino-7-oxononanoate synthase